MQNIRPNRGLPNAAHQIRHIVSIFSLPFDDIELNNFNEKFTIKYEAGNYRVLNSKMPMLKKPSSMLEFISDCYRYDIPISLKVNNEKEASLYNFLYDNE